MGEMTGSTTLRGPHMPREKATREVVTCINPDGLGRGLNESMPRKSELLRDQGPKVSGFLYYSLAIISEGTKDWENIDKPSWSQCRGSAVSDQGLARTKE